MVFTYAKSKKLLVFIEFICSFPSASLLIGTNEQLPNETLFLITTLDPWYGDIIIYLQTSTFWSASSKDDCQCIRHQSQPYRIIAYPLYRVGVDSVLRRCLTLDEDERVLNDYHSGTCGGHSSGYATAQNILCVGYSLPSIFKIPFLFPTNSMSAKFISGKCGPHRLSFTSLLLLVPLPNGALIL